MPIYKGKPNPLNLFNCRLYEYPAEHLYFLDIERSSYNLEAAIQTWIEQNLSGRYYISNDIKYNANSNNNRKSVIVLGFENPKEASFFQLACPLLKY
jgi:hypothetical protein